jgi:hypothetical protein
VNTKQHVGSGFPAEAGQGGERQPESGYISLPISGLTRVLGLGSSLTLQKTPTAS